MEFIYINIVYKYNYTPITIIFVVVVSLVVLISFLFFKPMITKTHGGILSGDKEMIVSLSLKNRSRRILKNVVVRDFVPAIAKVVRKFDTIEPQIKRVETGTELLWKIERIKPREEVILTYRIKPVVEVIGSFTLPKAKFTYETRKGKSRRIASKTVTVRGKI